MTKVTVGSTTTTNVKKTSPDSASQAEVNAGAIDNKYVSPKTLALKALKNGTYGTELRFDEDKDIYKDATGLSITFTLSGSNNVNGAMIVLRLNKPTAVTFPSNFEAGPNSTALDATKLNVYSLAYFSNWNGSGTARVVYNNLTFTAI